MKIDWKSLKKFIDETGLYKFLNYVELDTSYYVWVYYEGESFSSGIDKGTVDCEVFVRDYKTRAVLKNDLSEDGIKMSRTTFVGRERMMRCLFTTFTTSIAQTNDPSGFITIHLRDSMGNLIQDGSLAYYTEVDFCPGVGIPYGLYGGGIETTEDINSEVIGDAFVAPDIPAQYGGNIKVICNRVLKLPREEFLRKAINVGDILAIAPGANVFRIRLKHEMGMQKRFQTEVQYYI